MKAYRPLLAALLLCFGLGAAAQDDQFPEFPDHTVPLQYVIKEWHTQGLYTAGWDKPATIRNYVVGLANAYPNDLFQMIVAKIAGLDVDDALWEYVLDVQNGYVSAKLGTETIPSMQMCYWRCSDGSRLVGVALEGYEYNLEEREPDPNWTDEEMEDHIHVRLNDIAFFRILGDQALWRPVPVRTVCGRDFDFKEYDKIELPHQGKDIRLITLDEEGDEHVTALKWNGNGFTPSR